MLLGLQRKKLKVKFGLRQVGKCFGNVLANSFSGVSHVGVCCCIAAAKSQLHRVCTCAVQCT